MIGLEIKMNVTIPISTEKKMGKNNGCVEGRHTCCEKKEICEEAQEGENRGEMAN